MEKVLGLVVAALLAINYLLDIVSKIKALFGQSEKHKSPRTRKR